MTPPEQAGLAGNPEACSGRLSSSVSGVPNLMESARRWSGFVCPDCRFVFRAPRNHDGRGVVCPACRRLLRIPEAGEDLPPLVLPVKEADADEKPKKKKRRRRGLSRRKDVPTWDHKSSDADTSPLFSRKLMFSMLAGGVVLLASVLLWLFNTMDHHAPEPIITSKKPAPDPVIEVADGEYAPYTEQSFLEAAEVLMGKFLNATSVDEILPLVRNPEIAGPRLREAYPDGIIEPLGMSAFNVGWNMRRDGNFVALNVRTQALLVQSVAIELRPDALKVDWECWQGWSEMKWDEFSVTKPTSGKLFRVSLSKEAYYNFAFADEEVWQSYRLLSPGGEHALWGYAKRGSEVHDALNKLSFQQNALCTLILSFPENAQSANQVVIEKLVTPGWIIQDTTSP